jgi:hypothetical protein
VGSRRFPTSYCSGGGHNESAMVHLSGSFGRTVAREVGRVCCPKSANAFYRTDVTCHFWDSQSPMKLVGDFSLCAYWAARNDGMREKSFAQILTPWHRLPYRRDFGWHRGLAPPTKGAWFQAHCAHSHQPNRECGDSVCGKFLSVPQGRNGLRKELREPPGHLATRMACTEGGSRPTLVADAQGSSQRQTTLALPTRC